MAIITINTDEMPYSPPQIEFMRFGGRVGGQGTGCCAFDIIQGFSTNPEAEAYAPLTHGDELTPICEKGEQLYLGRTNKEVFEGYLRIGTFDQTEMPNHGFLAILSEGQLSGVYGKQWLKILKDNGFEFIRAVDNSVYSGTGPDLPPEGTTADYPSIVYLFGLFRNIGRGALKDPFKAPKAWEDLPAPERTVRDIWIDSKTTLLRHSEVYPDEPADQVSLEKASPFVTAAF